MSSNEVIRAQRKEVAARLGVKTNEAGTEFYGMRESDSIAWMCVFHKHETCEAEECFCDCHEELTPEDEAFLDRLLGLAVFINAKVESGNLPPKDSNGFYDFSRKGPIDG